MARLSPENVRRARDLIALYPQSRSALIPILHVAQEQDGWLTADAMAHVGELLGLTAAEVYGTASFYDMFFTAPVGRHLVSVCTNLACMLMGAEELLEHAESRLGVAAGGTTPDGEFTLEEVECIAFCGAAPCVAVNWRFFGNIGNDDFDRLVDDLAGGRLADEVPPHGTLCRVRRTVGLLSGRGPGDGQAAAPPAEEGDTAPAQGPSGGQGPSGPSSGGQGPSGPSSGGQGPARSTGDARGEPQPAGSGSSAQAAGQAAEIKGSGEGGSKEGTGS